MSVAWQLFEEQTLTKLLNKNWSYSEIAKEMKRKFGKRNYTRNGISGKVYRMRRIGSLPME